VYFVLTVTGWC